MDDGVRGKGQGAHVLIVKRRLGGGEVLLTSPEVSDLRKWGGRLRQAGQQAKGIVQDYLTRRILDGWMELRSPEAVRPACFHAKRKGCLRVFERTESVHTHKLAKCVVRADALAESLLHVIIARWAAVLR